MRQATATAVERRGHLKTVFLGSIALMVAVQIGFLAWLPQLAAVVGLLLAFFVAFNLLEASLPSMVSRIAPANARGTALGVYNTTQALGLFVGGAAGGWLAEHHGESSVFVFGLVLFALWFGVAFGMDAKVGRQTPRTGKATST